ncbi:hypothetical protein [Nakamurella alba]
MESLNTRYRRAVRAWGHFPNKRQRSSASTWSPDRWTRRGREGHDG